MTDVVRSIKDLNIGKVDEDCLMSKYTTYKVGGKVKAIVYPKNLCKKDLSLIYLSLTFATISILCNN